MTPERLAEIRANDEAAIFPNVTTAAIDRRDLLAEVDRLRAQLTLSRHRTKEVAKEGAALAAEADRLQALNVELVEAHNTYLAHVAVVESERDRLRAQVAAVDGRNIIGVARCAHQCPATVFVREGDGWEVLTGWLLTTGSGWACPEHRDRS